MRKNQKSTNPGGRGSRRAAKQVHASTQQFGGSLALLLHSSLKPFQSTSRSLAVAAAALSLRTVKSL